MVKEEGTVVGGSFVWSGAAVEKAWLEESVGWAEVRRGERG